MEIESNKSQIFTFTLAEARTLYDTLTMYLINPEVVKSCILTGGTEKKPVPITFLFPSNYQPSHDADEQASFDYDESTGEITDDGSENKTVKLSQHEVKLFSKESIERLAKELGIGFTEGTDVNIIVADICKDNIDLDEEFIDEDGNVDYEKLEQYLEESADE